MGLQLHLTFYFVTLVHGRKWGVGEGIKIMALSRSCHAKVVATHFDEFPGARVPTLKARITSTVNRSSYSERG